MTCFTRIHTRHQSSFGYLKYIYGDAVKFGTICSKILIKSTEKETFNCLYFASGTFFLPHSDLISLTKHVFDRSQVNVLYTDTLTLDTSASLKYRTNIFTLYIKRILPLLVLGNFVGLVLLALLAEGPAGFRDVHLHNTE